MASKTGRPVKSVVRQIACFPLSGTMLKLYMPRKRPRGEPKGGPLSIVIVNLIPFLGDAVLYLPLIDQLRSNHPDATITVFCSDRVLPLYKAYPGVDEALSIDNDAKRWVDRTPFIRLCARFSDARRFAQSAAKTRRFDIALLPRGGAEPYFSAHTAWMLGAERIYGYSSYLEPERRYMQQDSEPLMTGAVTNKRHLHESMRALEVAECAGLLAADDRSETEVAGGLQKLAEAQDFAAIARLAGIEGDRPYAVIAPAAGARRREWPTARFQEIAIRLQRDLGLTVLVIGTKAEQSLVDSVCSVDNHEIRGMVGNLNVLQLVGLLSKATLFVGNDSGVGHIAGALGTPTISLNAYAMAGAEDHHQSPARNKPMGPHVQVLQPQRFLPPCAEECVADESHCLGQIDVESVWDGVLKVLGPERWPLYSAPAIQRK